MQAPLILTAEQRDLLLSIPSGLSVEEPEVGNIAEDFLNAILRTPDISKQHLLQTPERHTSPGSFGSVGLSSPERKDENEDREDGGGGPVDVEAALSGRDPRTTVMLKRIPRRITKQDLSELLDLIPGVAGWYDFTHIPWDASRQSSRGFAFVNLLDSVHVGVLAEALEIGNVPPEFKETTLKYAQQQGTKESLQRFLERETSRANSLESALMQRRRMYPNQPHRVTGGRFSNRFGTVLRSVSQPEPPGFERRQS